MSDTETTTDDDRSLMEALRTAHDRSDARAVNRLVTTVWDRHGETIKRATRTYPDAEGAAWAVLQQMTSRGGVRLFLAAWQKNLEAYAVIVARQSHAARDAGLLSRKIVRYDAAYAGRSTSLDSLIEAHGDYLRGARTLEALEAERRRETRAMREGFESIGGTLTGKQREAVIRYANLHVDHADAEMATRQAVAKNLDIKRQSLNDRLAGVTRRVEADSRLRTALGRLVGDEERVEREADASRKHYAARAEAKAA